MLFSSLNKIEHCCNEDLPFDGVTEAGLDLVLMKVVSMQPRVVVVVVVDFLLALTKGLMVFQKQRLLQKPRVVSVRAELVVARPVKTERMACDLQSNGRSLEMSHPPFVLSLFEQVECMNRHHQKMMKS